MYVVLTTGPNKNRNKLLYSSSIVLFSAGERWRGGEGKKVILS